jgi:hypothetical protein
MNSQIYCTKILNDFGYPFYEKIAEAKGIALRQEDGAGYHRSIATKKMAGKYEDASHEMAYTIP